MGSKVNKRMRKFIRRRQSANRKRLHRGKPQVDPSKNSITHKIYMARKRNIEDDSDETDVEEKVEEKVEEVKQDDGGFAPEGWKAPDDLADVNDFLEGNFSSASSASDPEADGASSEEPVTLDTPKEKIEDLNKKLENKIAAHQTELDKLKEKDPEFYEFLKEQGSALLQFGGQEGGKSYIASDIDSEAEAEEEAAALDEMEASTSEGSEIDHEKKREGKADAQEKRKESRKVRPETLDMAKLQELMGNLLTRELPCWLSMKKLINNYKWNCYYTSSDLSNQSGRPLVVDAEVYSTLMKFTISKSGMLFDRFLAGKKNIEVNYYILPNNNAWKRVRKYLEKFFVCSMDFCQTAPDPTMKRFVIHHLAKMMSFLRHLPRIQKRFLRLLISLWGSEQPMEVRVDAFTAIYEMGRLLNRTVLRSILKMTYHAYGRRTRRLHVHNSSKIAFLRDCLVQLFGIDLELTYQVGFVSLRELVILLRRCILSSSKPNEQKLNKKERQHIKERERQRKKRRRSLTGRDAHTVVHNWIYINSLRLWTTVVSKHGVDKASPVSSLMYPLVQLIQGVMNVKDGKTFIPFRFHCCDLICELIENTGVHIPMIPNLIFILDSGTMKKQAKKSDGFAIDLKYRIKFKKEEAFPSIKGQDAMVDESLKLILRYCRAYAYSLAFPELVVPVVFWLRRVSKQTELHYSYRKKIMTLAQRLEKNADWVKDKRETAGFTPTDLLQCANFLSEEKIAKAAPLEVDPEPVIKPIETNKRIDRKWRKWEKKKRKRVHKRSAYKLALMAEEAKQEKAKKKERK